MNTDTVVKPDIKAMRAILAYIKAHPEDWDQRYWAVRVLRGRATYNFAGLAIVLDGQTILWTEGDNYASHCKRPGQSWPTERIQSRAQRVLGLTDTQADMLFGGGNTLADLKRLVSQIRTGNLT